MDQRPGSNKITVGSSSLPVRAPVRSSSTDRSIEEIRTNIEQTRNEITDTVDLLGERLKETVDWRSYVGEHPLIAVGGAALLGLYLTRKLMTPKRNTSEELLHSLMRTARDAFVPKRPAITLTLLTLAGKFALEQFQQYQSEQEQLKQQDEQLEALQAYQHLLNQQMESQPQPRRRTAGSD